jgi:hypothetical protein
VALLAKYVSSKNATHLKSQASNQEDLSFDTLESNKLLQLYRGKLPHNDVMQLFSGSKNSDSGTSRLDQ